MTECCKKWAVFLAAIAWSVMTAAVVSGQVTSCLPPNAAAPGNQPNQPLVPDSFRVKIEETKEEENVTQQIEMIVDVLGNRAILKTMSQGQETTEFFFYDTQEIITVSDAGNNCTVYNMTADPERFVFFRDTMIDGRGHIPDGASALYFGKDIVKVYKGRGHIIRGIECEMWQTCFAAPQDPHTNLTFSYYFSVKSWTTPSLFTQAPVRYDLTGQKLYGNGSVTTFHYSYNFFDFLPSGDFDSTVFEIPEGVVCPGRASTQTMPDLSLRYFHFQEEIIDVSYDKITQAEIWYDLDQKLVRVDYRTPSPVPPVQTSDPVSVIHDYNFGVSYVKDKVSGECRPMALAPNVFDGRVNLAAYLQNGSFSTSMKAPRAFFFLDSNFTYTGQRYSRNALCEVFISHRYDFDYYNNGTGLEATVEVYFLAEGWQDFSKDSGGRVSQRSPVRVEIWIPKVNQNMVYNIFGFDADRPDISVFDVTDCYDDSASISFRVRFLGPYHRDREHEVRVVSQDTLTRAMGVSPLRINNLQLQYDSSYLYLSATLLDRTPSLAQFTHLPKAVSEKVDDFQFGNVSTADDCSQLCVTNPVIRCQSFEYCPNERGGTCRLSKRHISDGLPSVTPSPCDLYSRTVTVTGPPELTAKQAFSKLKDTIKERALYFEVEQDDEELVFYGAVEAEMLFGRLEEVKLRALTGQFSYRVETVYPRQHQADIYDVWYDSVSKLVRVDRRDVTASAPFYSPFTITTIHDYNTGISYSVDRYRGNCTVGTIPANSTFDGQTVNLTQALTTGLYTLSMKTPLMLFHLDDTYTFTGQKTVRGILCDVFESKRTDFTLGSSSQQSVFQYFFQSGSWQYVADTHDDITLQQPVQLLISDEQASEFIIYNFYDFNDEHISYSNFDIAPCFTDDQKIDFILDLNQTYHPFLDGREWQFKQEAQQVLARDLRMSSLRIQNLRLTYNLDRTYLTATLLGQVAPQLHFVETGRSSPFSAQVVAPAADAATCASACYYSRELVCNSFNLCPASSCYLSTLHVPDGNVTNPAVTCRHFSRITDGTVPEPTVSQAYESLKDQVFKGLLSISLTSQNGTQTMSYTAVGVRNDLFSLNPPTETGAEDLHSKFRLYKTDSGMQGSAQALTGLAVDECATLCWHKDAFACRAFTYCYSQGDCRLNANRPANNPGLVTAAQLCDVYTRLYVDDYQRYPGQVMESTEADRALVTARTEEECARQCSSTTSSSPFLCRSFDFCPATGHCVMHRLHVLDYDAPLLNTSLCSHFSRDYLPDFTLQALKVVPGFDAVVIDGVSASTCATRCVQQPSCQSFEFCGGTCRLSSVLPTPSLISDSNDCDLYTLTADGTTADRPIVNPPGRTTTSASGGKITPAEASTGKITPAGASTGKITPAGASTGKITPAGASTGTPHRPPTPHSGGASPRPSSSSGITTPGDDPSGCSGKQTGSGKSDDTGARVGIGVGVLVLGLVLGAALVLLVQKLRGTRRDDASIELVPRMR